MPQKISFYFFISILIHIIVVFYFLGKKHKTLNLLNNQSHIEIQLIATAENKINSNAFKKTEDTSGKIKKNKSDQVKLETPNMPPLQVSKAATASAAATAAATTTAAITSANSTVTAATPTMSSKNLGIIVVYPRISRALSEQGQVIIKIKINNSGNISEKNIQQTSGFKRLDEAAIEALNKSEHLTLAANTELKISFIFKLIND